MRKIHVVAIAAFIAIVGLSGAAFAAPAFLPHSATLRAGPGGEYPSVARIPAGAGVDVHGCVAGWSWCDVNAGAMRGWVYGPALAPSAYAPYQPIATFGPTLGLSIVLFDQGDYWGRYYRDRPFYATWHARNIGRANTTIRDNRQQGLNARARRLQAIQPAAGARRMRATTHVRAAQPKLAPRNVSSHGGRAPRAEGPRGGGKGPGDRHGKQ